MYAREERVSTRRPGATRPSVRRPALPGAISELQRAVGNAAVSRSIGRGAFPATPTSGRPVVVQRLHFIATVRGQPLKVTVSDQKITSHTVAGNASDAWMFWLVWTAGRTDLPVRGNGKTLFPGSWSTEKITAAIQHVYENNAGWAPHGDHDEDAVGTYQGVSITLRRKRGIAIHVTSAWPTGPVVLDPATEWARFSHAMAHMNWWISYFGTSATVTDLAQQSSIAQATMTNFYGYRNTTMWAYVASTYDAAWQLHAQIEQEQRRRAIAALSGEATSLTTTTARLKELHGTLAEMLNSTTYDVIQPVLDSIKQRLSGLQQ